MDTITGLRILARVVEAGSFSEAGRQLGVAPSSVSRQINHLEDSLGARLFQRTTRKLSLTEAGELYYERATRIVTEIDILIEIFFSIFQKWFQPKDAGVID